jgi:hypothetical protein
LLLSPTRTRIRIWMRIRTQTFLTVQLVFSPDAKVANLHAIATKWPRRRGGGEEAEKAGERAAGKKQQRKKQQREKQQRKKQQRKK